MVASDRDGIDFVVEGMEDVIELDLAKHRDLRSRLLKDLESFKQAMAHEISKKKHYKGLIGGGKYNDEALRASIQDININIRHLSDKVYSAEEKIKFETHIIDTLSEDLRRQYNALDKLAAYRKKAGNGNAD